MLTITDAQLLALAQAAEAKRQGVSLERLAELFPEDAEILGRAGLDRVVQLCIARARAHGFDSTRALHKYVVQMFIFGSFFDADPLLTWPRAALADGADQETRIDALVAAARTYLAGTAGADGAHYRRALLRLRRLAPQQLEGDPERLAERFRAVLASVFPEQNAALSDALAALACDRARGEALRQGLSPTSGPLLWALLMVMIGSGFAADPLHPWAGEALASDATASPAIRTMTLFDRTMRRLATYIAANRARQARAS